MENEQISLAPLVVILVVGGLIIRYLFFSPAAPAGQAQHARDPVAALRQREAVVERIQQMFPQVDRRTALWDLHRNGGNMTATAERILAGRMETPPVTFQPPPPPPSPASAAAGATAQAATKAPSKPAEPDLITRYKLQDRVTSAGCSQQQQQATDQGSSSGSKPKGWSSNRDERQSALQRRRDNMILEARRKMEAKIAAEKTGAGEQ